MLILASCAGPSIKPDRFDTFDNVKEEAGVTNQNQNQTYLLNAGDKLSIKFYYQPTLNQEVVVRPDGKISLQLINDITAAGKTPELLAEQITSQYKKYIKRSEATVIVSELGKKPIYIGGEVSRPGFFEVAFCPTVLQVVFMAGGETSTAKLTSVILIRRVDNNKKPKIYIVNLENPNNDILCRPYDVIYVPKSAIASADLFVDQYINKLIPISRSFGFSFVYDLNNGDSR
ncbi:MAG: polysaccharide biosynthesis/export family protein [bacterium]|nr:polysaccharide biosynthesis/export family protein [bacterium]